VIAVKKVSVYPEHGRKERVSMREQSLPASMRRQEVDVATKEFICSLGLDDGQPKLSSFLEEQTIEFSPAPP
jgi:hypothetical protein